MSAAELFGLIVSVLLFGYLLYALLRGENLYDDRRRAGSRSRSSSRS